MYRVHDARDAVKLLVQSGSDVNAKSDDGKTPLLTILSQGYKILDEPEYIETGENRRQRLDQIIDWCLGTIKDAGYD